MEDITSGQNFGKMESFLLICEIGNFSSASKSANGRYNLKSTTNKFIYPLRQDLSKVSVNFSQLSQIPYQFLQQKYVPLPEENLLFISRKKRTKGRSNYQACARAPNPRFNKFQQVGMFLKNSFTLGLARAPEPAHTREFCDLCEPRSHLASMPGTCSPTHKITFLQHQNPKTKE